MKVVRSTNAPYRLAVTIALFISGLAFVNAQTGEAIKSEPQKPAVASQPPIYWQVKAFRPQASLMNIKAIDKKGDMHDVKAIQSSDDTSILDVKALVNGEQLPIKLIVKKDDRYYPVKAIDNDGYLINIKAVTENGDILDVKGVSRSGNIVHLRAIDKHLVAYTIIAVSPEGKVNDIKGIKMLDTEVETVINGVQVFAHVKSLAQQ
ncbi:hypothetical protein FK220_011455 [Flavobacteriaceae bacterium TP-CH-4]|uniref:DUF7486 domain-containing protein n=1 Tax=Pelagihabitans pacificus TaxID=2696054 RepID=A0A967AT88_9FLAO|nr:hypothetical protein [Pelagihabitans pacificus]NHF59961.1 hypothetical protein [Pelagihabitans pacificus]